MKRIILPAVLAASIFTFGNVVSAQDAPPAGQNGGGQGGGRGQRGNFDPAQFQQQMTERLKTSLKVSDEEWGVIKPLLEKVQAAQTKQRETRGGMGGFGGRGGGGGGRGGNQAQGSPAPGNNNNQGGGRGGNRQSSPEVEALRTALDNEGTSADDIKNKLNALRDARKKATAELEAARADLAKVLTVRQEATLVMSGMLE